MVFLIRALFTINELLILLMCISILILFIFAYLNIISLYALANFALRHCWAQAPFVRNFYTYTVC